MGISFRLLNLIQDVNGPSSPSLLEVSIPGGEKGGDLNLLLNCTQSALILQVLAGVGVSRQVLGYSVLTVKMGGKSSSLQPLISREPSSSVNPVPDVSITFLLMLGRAPQAVELRVHSLNSYPQGRGDRTAFSKVCIFQGMCTFCN